MELSRSLQWETTTTWRNLKTLSTRALSCDGDDDGVLDATEFSSCLHQLLNFERKLSEDPLNDKPACLEKFRIEADTNENNEVDFSEYLRWSSEWASLYGRNERGEPEQLPNEVNRIEENAEKQEERQKLIIIIVPESAKIAAER
ncbi:EF-hand domain pair [Trinorchestia longiramus]|nr:EF-hand domain pair [Trinorchestia longiramus]